MQNMNGGNDPNRILNDCRDIDHSLDQIEKDLQGLQSIQYTILNGSGDPRDNRAGQARLNQANDSIISSYQGLVQRMKKIKGMPDSASPRNAPQVGRVDRRLKSTIQKYQGLERDFRRDLQDSIARQVRIVKPDATDEEVRQAAEDPSQQVFAQAVSIFNVPAMRLRC
jgi:syntaxin 1B/2/3